MSQPGQSLYVHLESDGTIKVGTCSHCVIEEKGKPERAWKAQGDSELDFDRDALIAALEKLGVAVVIEQEYVCP